MRACVCVCSFAHANVLVCACVCVYVRVCASNLRWLAQIAEDPKTGPYIKGATERVVSTPDEALEVHSVRSRSSVRTRAFCASACARACVHAG